MSLYYCTPHDRLKNFRDRFSLALVVVATMMCSESCEWNHLGIPKAILSQKIGTIESEYGKYQTRFISNQ